MGIGTNRSVLLVDDEELSTTAMRDHLRRSGYRCDTATDAAGALRAAASHEYDVVVMALGAPGNGDGDGLEGVRRFRRSFPSVPVIVTTTTPSVETAVGAMRASTVDYLVKPVAPDELDTRIGGAMVLRDRLRSVARLKGLFLEASAEVESLEAVAARLHVTGGEPGVCVGGDSSSAQQRLRTLSRREREIFRAVLSGQRTAAVAASLGISTNTARNHLKNIFRKLDVRSQLELLSRYGLANV